MSKNNIRLFFVCLSLSVILLIAGCQRHTGPITVTKHNGNTFITVSDAGESENSTSAKTKTAEGNAEETVSETQATVNDADSTQAFQQFITEIIADPNRLYSYYADYCSNGGTEGLPEPHPYFLDPEAKPTEFAWVYPIVPGAGGTNTWLFYKEYDPDQYGKVMKGKLYPGNEYHDTLLLVQIPKTNWETNQTYAPDALFAGGGSAFDHLYFAYDKNSNQMKLIEANHFNPVEIEGQLIIKTRHGSAGDSLGAHKLETIDGRWRAVDMQEYNIELGTTNWSDIDTFIMVNGVNVDVCSDNFINLSEANITEDLESLLH